MQILIYEYKSPAKSILSITSDATFHLPVPRKPSPNLHGLNLLGNVHIRFPEKITCNSAFYCRNIHLRAQYIWLSTNDAIFVLPVPRKPSPNLHGLNLYGNVYFQYPQTITLNSAFHYINIDLRAQFICGRSPSPTTWFTFLFRHRFCLFFRYS